MKGILWQPGGDDQRAPTRAGRALTGFERVRSIAFATQQDPVIRDETATDAAGGPSAAVTIDLPVRSQAGESMISDGTMVGRVSAANRP